MIALSRLGRSAALALGSSALLIGCKDLERYDTGPGEAYCGNIIGAEFIRRSAASLSPGERTRVAMALLQARGCNLLVLDEPTNHLDLEAIEQLEQALDSFDGTVLLVSHDRRMLDNVRLTRRWHVEDGRVAEIAAD